LLEIKGWSSVVCLNRFIYISLLLFFGRSSLWGQSVADTPAVSDSLKTALVVAKVPNQLKLVEVTSQPAGVIVRLNGAYSFVGRTPFKVPYPLLGRYDVKAGKPGYESEASVVEFVQNEESSLSIRLIPKTRWKAAIRSLVFPGWGQFYGGERLKAIVIGAIQAGLAGYTLMAINDYNDSNRKMNLAFANFNAESKLEDFQEVQARYLGVRNDYDYQQTLVLISAGFWAANLIDSFLFFSNGRHSIDVLPVEASMSGGLGKTGFRLSWRMAF